MKKYFKLIFISLILILLGGCSLFNKKESQTVKYNDLRATFITSQGNINFYLYPEASPLITANFINLALRGYYNNTTFHRAIENFMIQGGDRTGTGQGDLGYFIKDEFIDWLDFYQPGMLAMANMGPNTNSSQFFMTIYPADSLNQRYSIFGEFVSQGDYEKIKKLERGDVIKEVKIEGDYELFLALHKKQIEEWNKMIDKKYPNLKKYPIKSLSTFGVDVQNYKDELKKIYKPKEKRNQKDREYLIPKLIRKTEKVIEKL